MMASDGSFGTLRIWLMTRSRTAGWASVSSWSQYAAVTES